MSAFFLDETGRLRTVWRFGLFGIGFVIVQVVATIAVALGFLGYLAISGQPVDSLFTNPRGIEQWTVPLQIAGSLPITLGCLGLVLVCRRYLDRRSIRSLGLTRPGRNFTTSIAGGFVIGSVPVIIAIGIALVAGGFVWLGVSASVQTALLIPTLILMAFCEEIVCRGYLLQNLIDIRRPLWGILFSSVVFWLLHSLNPAVWSSPMIAINLFGAGVTLALAYRTGGNIWFPTSMHFGWNFAQGVLFEIPVSGIRTDGLFDLRIVESSPEWFTGGSFGIEGSILATFAEVGMSILLGAVLLRRARPVQVADSQAA